MVTATIKRTKVNPKGIPKEKRKPIFVGSVAHDIFKKSAEKADRNYDPHLVRLVAFYEKWKGKHPDDE